MALALMKRYRITKIILVFIILIVAIFKISPPVVIQHVNNAEQIEFDLTHLEEKISYMTSPVPVIDDTEEVIARLRKRATGLKSEIASRRSMKLWFYTFVACLLMLGIILDQALELRRIRKIS